MKKIRIAEKEIIHFIGVGGIGMSGLAQVMRTMGFKIQGSDISLNKNIERLKKIELYNSFRLVNQLVQFVLIPIKIFLD